MSASSTSTNSDLGGHAEIKDGFLYMHGEFGNMLSFTTRDNRMIAALTVTYTGNDVWVYVPTSPQYQAKEILEPGARFTAVIPQRTVTLNIKNSETDPDAKIERIDFVLVDTETPQTPEFSTTDEYVDFEMVLKVYSKFGAEINLELVYPDDPESNRTVSGSAGVVETVIRETVQVTAWAKNYLGETEKVTRTYHLRKPNPPTLSVVSGTYPAGTLIEVSSDIPGSCCYNVYYNGEKSEKYSYTFITGPFHIPVGEDLKDLTVSVYAAGGGKCGPESDFSEPVTVTMQPLSVPVAYVDDVRIDNTETLAEGTEVTFKAPDATWLVWYEYDIFGIKTYKTQVGNEMTVTVDKNNRRFQVMNFCGWVVDQNNRYSAPGDFFFGLEDNTIYDMTVRYSEYTGDVTGKDSGAVTLSAEVPGTYQAAFVADGNTYTAALDSDKNLCGRFTISLDGQELAGYAKQAQTDFHTGVTFGEDEEQCSVDHAPYVYVQSTPTGGDSKEYNLVPSTHAQAVPLSTNPNEYHGRLVHHQNAVLTVKLNPFVSTPRLSLTSAVATGVDNVAVDAADAEAVYYDMAGRRMQGELVPGVYLEVRGTQTRKVVVK